MAKNTRFSSAAGIGVGFAATAALVALTGCRATPAAKPADSSIVSTYDSTGHLQSLTFDRNHDGKPDAWLKMRGTHVISADLDEDFDGKVDRREVYADNAAAPGTAPGALPTLPRTDMVRAEQSTGGDGVMNRVEFYEHGKLTRVEEDTNADGRVDKWETWVDGTLVTVAFDTKGSGKPDRRIVYAADGGESRMEVDTKGDGTFTPLAH